MAKLIWCGAACFVCAAVAMPSRAQLTLNRGESWVYRFNTLAPMGGGSVGGGYVAGGEVQVALDPSSVHAGDALRCEMFEADTNQPPVCVTVVTNAAAGECSAAGAWQDRRGAVRFTVLSGSVTVNSFTLQASTFFPPSFAYFYSTTVVPPAEPRHALRIRHEGSGVKLLWPGAAEGYALQSSPAVTGAAWTDVEAEPGIEEGDFVVTLAPGGASAFYRLIKR